MACVAHTDLNNERTSHLSRRDPDFCPLEVAGLSGAEHAALREIVDAHPQDGMVSLVEWKRFCKLVERSGLSFYDFVKIYAEKFHGGP